jgi:hypothetical protein
MPTRPRPSRRLLATLLLLAPTALVAQSAPKTGLDVLKRMHDAYAKSWYHTLTAVRTTKSYGPGQRPDNQLWFESRAAPGLLRYEMGLRGGSVFGVISTTDSSFMFNHGAVVQRSGGSNSLMALTMGVYLQDPAKTAAQLRDSHIDLTKVSSGVVEGTPVWIVGATSAGDTTSPQFRVEVQRLVLLRLISRFRDALLTSDIRLDDYRQVGKGWLATRVTTSPSRVSRQQEVYSDWEVDPPLSPDLFDPAKLSTDPH